MRRHHVLSRSYYLLVAFAVVMGALVVGVSSATTIRPSSTQVDHAVGLTAPPRTTSTGWAPQPSGPALSPIAAARPKPAGSGISGEASALSADGIPATALQAYQQAANTEQLVNPGCGLAWPLLAGIGRVESDHGRYGGATLYTDGVSLPKIIGIALNGQGTALILDTDHGQLDGDTVYDHAVGPMQFIPSTWAHYGVDGNYDGIVDPFNIFDAALTTAHYLCAAGGNLTTLVGQTTAVLTYNHSDAYVALVLGLEAVYAQGVQGLTVPVLPPAGARPGSAGVPAAGIPPADPGSALGVPVGSPAASPSAPGTAGSTSTSGPTSPGSTPSASGSPALSPALSPTPSPAPSPTQTSPQPSMTAPGPSPSTCPPATPGASSAPTGSPTGATATGTASPPATAVSQAPGAPGSTSSASCRLGP